MRCFTCLQVLKNSYFLSLNQRLAQYRPAYAASDSIANYLVLANEKTGCGARF